MQLPVAIRDRRWRSVLPELTGTRPRRRNRR
jgi:hypothetical protein